MCANKSSFSAGPRRTCVWSTDAAYRSHMGLTSSPSSRSKSPWRKNSSMMRSVHWRYKYSGFVGLLRSAQCTSVFRICSVSQKSRRSCLRKIITFYSLIANICHIKRNHLVNCYISLEKKRSWEILRYLCNRHDDSERVSEVHGC